MKKLGKYLTYSNVSVTIALVVSFLALIVSVYEATIMNSQQKAMVWPHVNIKTQYSENGFSLIAINNGIGPALVNSMEVSYKDFVAESYIELVDKIEPNREFGYNILKMGYLNGTVMKAGEERVLFNLPFNKKTNAIIKKLGDLNIIVQYSSVLSERWTFNMSTKKTVEESFASEREFKN